MQRAAPLKGVRFHIGLHHLAAGRLPVLRTTTVTPRAAATGEYTIADLAELFTVSRTTVYRTLQRDTATAEQDRR